MPRHATEYITQNANSSFSSEGFLFRTQWQTKVSYQILPLSFFPLWDRFETVQALRINTLWAKPDKWFWSQDWMKFNTFTFWTYKVPVLKLPDSQSGLVKLPSWTESQLRWDWRICKILLTRPETNHEHTDQLSPAYGSQFVAQFVATFPTAPQSLEMLEKRMGDVKDALDEIRHVAELVTNATSDLQKSQHLAFRSELLRKGAKVSPALLTNHRHWVYFQNGLDDAFYWYYEHEKHLALMIDGLRDQRAIIRLFWGRFWSMLSPILDTSMLTSSAS